MSDAFKQLMAEHRRLSILRWLAGTQTGGQSNDYILTSVVNGAGIQSSRDQIKTALAWLQEQELVTLKTLDTGTVVATIRQRGIEAAQGIITVPGVQRPAPGA